MIVPGNSGGANCGWTDRAGHDKQPELPLAHAEARNNERLDSSKENSLIFEQLYQRTMKAWNDVLAR
jgi:hypothetical protein